MRVPGSRGCRRCRRNDHGEAAGLDRVVVGAGGAGVVAVLVVLMHEAISAQEAWVAGVAARVSAAGVRCSANPSSSSMRGDVVDGNRAPDAVAEVFNLRAVVLRQHDAVDSDTVRGEQLRGYAADPEQVAGEGELAGHRQAAAQGAVGESGDRRGSHNDPA